jgi:putative ABC transport system permease protein
MLIICFFIGIAISNIELNRTIYCNEVHMKASEQSYRNEINNYNLDDMEEKLDKLEDKMNNPQKYKSDDNDIVFKINVPKYRVLFNFKPFDLRFETGKYRLCINGTIIDNLQKTVYQQQVYFVNNKKNIIENLVNINKKIYNLKIEVSKYKFNLNNYLK